MGHMEPVLGGLLGPQKEAIVSRESAYVGSKSLVELSSFGGLVLLCVDSYGSEKRRIKYVLQFFFLEMIYKICIPSHLSDLI